MTEKSPAHCVNLQADSWRFDFEHYRPLIEDAVRKYRGCVLFFDKALIEARMRALVSVADQSDCRVLMPVKALTHPVAIAIAARHIDGFDVSNYVELCSVERHLRKRLMSITGPKWHMESRLLGHPMMTKAMVNLDNRDQLLIFRKYFPNRRFGIRVGVDSQFQFCSLANNSNPSETNNPLRDQSRFGRDFSSFDQLDAVYKETGGGIEGLHFYQRLIQPDSMFHMRTARLLADWIRTGNWQVHYFNLGGSLHYFSLPEIEQLLRELRIYLPPAITMIIEPGDYLFKDTGFALSRVLSVVEYADRELFIVTLDISAYCHLHWSRVSLFEADTPRGMDSRAAFFGPTCMEADFICTGSLEGHPFGSPRLHAGDFVILKGVSGYSVSWNKSFNGTGKARILYVGEDTHG